jgi:hypothetical protein
LELVVLRPGESESDADAVMRHNGKSIEWYYSTFKKQQTKGQNNVNVLFDELNAYWATLPKPQQDQIFSVYVRIKEMFETFDNTKALTRSLMPLMTELYELHDLEDMDHWIRFHSGIRVPEKIADSFVESMDTSMTRQKTYTKEDYWRLLVLALALRAAVPIWGEIIGITEKQKILGTDWKEYAVYQLIGRSKLMYSPAMEKLRGYVSAYVPNDRRQYSAMLAGVGSEDYPEWLLSVIVVRRVAIGDIRSQINPESHLVSSIHSYILAKLNPSDSSFMGNIREKTPEREGSGDQENKLSRLEGYKIRQELPEGDIAMIAHYAKDPYRVAQRVCPRVPLELVEQSLESVKVLQSQHVQPPQLWIMQRVLEPAISPRGLQYLPKEIFLACMAVVQAILWMPRVDPMGEDAEYGHQELAALVSASADVWGTDVVEANLTSHGRIPKALTERLNALFPYPLRTSGKQSKEGGKTINVAVQNIDSLVKQFDACGWRVTLPSEWVKQLKERNPAMSGRHFAAPYEIRKKLANLIIDCETRSL